MNITDWFKVSKYALMSLFDISRTFCSRAIPNYIWFYQPKLKMNQQTDPVKKRRICLGVLAISEKPGLTIKELNSKDFHFFSANFSIFVNFLLIFICSGIQVANWEKYCSNEKTSRNGSKQNGRGHEVWGTSQPQWALRTLALR